ncbi:hypothetical protein C8Q76DRAFT_238692 [Earliella scabrosa]|nr:hypothetical protein C8Q76DRAFT_238692 [Earliella scabrosa]
MARTSQRKEKAEAGSFTQSPSPMPPGIWIQYKGPRARTLQTTKADARSANLQANILDEFQADIEALKLNVPGIPMAEIKIVWGTGQIRAMYGIRGNEFRKILRHLIGRAMSKQAELLSERSISRICGSPVESLGAASQNVPLSASSLLTSRRETLDRATASSSSSRSLHTPTTSTPHPPATPVNTYSGFHLYSAHPTSKQPQAFPHPVIPPRATVAVPHVNSPPAINVAGVGRDRPAFTRVPNPHPVPQILPPIHLRRDGREQQGPGAHEQTERTAEGRPNSPVALLKTSRALARSSLTTDACRRLRDPSDVEILSNDPVVRFLVLRDTDGASSSASVNVKSYEAFVTDGSAYAWMELSSSLRGRVGDRDDRRQLQIGSVAKLKRISRLHPAATCVGIIHDFELVECEEDSESWPATTSVPTSPSPAARIVDNSENSTYNRAARRLAEARLKEERWRRIVLEGVLANVCRDLESQGTLPTAVLQALTKIEELTDGAMVVD